MRQRWIVVLVIAVGCGLLPRPVWSASSTGEDTTPPTFTIGFPARGDFVSGSAEVTIQGTATDGQSGVASIEVNGQRAVLSGTAWSIPATLDFGLNIFTLQVTDQAGNVASTSWSALYSPTYLPAGERLSEGALSRIGPVVLEQIVSSGTIQQALIGAAGTSRGPFRIDSLTFGTPSVTVTLDQGGFQATIDIPNLIITGGVGRARLEFSTDATIDGVLVVSVTNGAFVASMPSPPTVTLSRLTRRKGPLPRPILKLLENALATALQTTLPPAVATALNEASGPHTRSWLGTIVSFEFTPRRIAIDAQNVQVTFDAHVTAASDPQIPASPGSVSRGQGAPPVLTGVHDVAVSVREDFVNQILHAAWHAGAGRVWIDRSHLATYGISLPFPLDATFLVPFFPALAALNPAGQPMPIAFDLNPALPPVFRITGAPDLATMSVGELSLSVLIDFGAGYQAVLTLVVHAEAGASLDISQGDLVISMGQPSRLTVSMDTNPFGLSQPDIDRFINTVLPPLVSLASGSIPPIPLPPPPWPLKVSSIDIRPDGPGADFVTIEGDL